MNPTVLTAIRQRNALLRRAAFSALRSSSLISSTNNKATIAGCHRFMHSISSMNTTGVFEAQQQVHQQVHQQVKQNRHFSDSKSPKKVGFKDSRLAGRRRFYKQVGIAPTAAPWEDDDDSDSTTTVDSPISAGVDGTQSATGVTTRLATNERKKDRLMPRKPGSSVPVESTNWYAIALDGRIVKTPLGQTLAVPSELLAWAIAAEWDAQENLLQPAQMPLMTLACTALDQTASAPHVAHANSLVYLPTDTTCYWTDPSEDRVLHRRQVDAWEGIHNHCEELFGERAAAAMGANEGLLMSRVRGAKSIGLPHPEPLVNGAEEFVKSLDAWHLTALSSVSSEAKSLLVGMALLSGGATPKKAAEAARVEEEFQISVWGLVEGGHDYDRLNCSIQIHAAHVMASAIAMDNNL